MCSANILKSASRHLWFVCKAYYCTVQFNLKRL